MNFCVVFSLVRLVIVLLWLFELLPLFFLLCIVYVAVVVVFLLCIVYVAVVVVFYHVLFLFLIRCSRDVVVLFLLL